MADTLGTIVVDLKANTAAFIEGMTRASAAAKHAGGEIHESFSKLGEIAGSMLAPFGEFGHVIGEVFGQIGSLGGSATQSLAKMSGGMNFLAIGGGIAVGALAAVEAAAIGLTVHTAEAAAKMLVMSQTTGVTVETLSGMAFVAKQSGVEAGVMENGLTKLNKAIFAAATAAPGTVNAFSRMRISVRDSNGELRGTEDVFRDVAEKFAAMEDGPIKGALAIQLFGKAGAGLIPILNQGKDGIDDFLATARSLGIVLDTETAEAAHKFEQSLNTLTAVGQGLEIHLMRELLPALQLITSQLVDGFKDKTSGLNAFIDGVVWLTKVTIALGDTFLTAFGSIGRGIGNAMAQLEELGKGIWAVGTSSSPSGLVAAFKESRDRMKAIDAQFISENSKAWQKNSNLIENLFGPRAPFTTGHERGGGRNDVDAKPAKEDSILERIKERIAALARETEEWLKIGQAGSQAEQLIAEAVKKGSDEYGKLRDMASKEKNPTLRASALSFVDSNQGMIEGAAAAGVYGAAIKAIVSELDKQHLKLESETTAAEALAAAYGTAGLAAALVNSHFADQVAKVQVLKDAHDQLAAKLGDENPEVQQLGEGYALANKELAADRVAYAAKVHADLNLEVKKATTAFDAELPALQAISAAYFETAAAARAAQVELKVTQFKNANPSADEGQVNRIRELEKQKSDEAFSNSIDQEAARYDLLQTYDLEAEKLLTVRERLQDYGRSTLLVDSAIYDSQRRNIEQWDAAALKVGNFSAKFRATMNQVVLEGQDFGAKLFQAIGKAIDELSTNLAKFVVTGKANFKQMFQGFEESVAKAGFQKLFSTVLGKLGFGGAKADGSASNPFYVKMADGEVGGLFGSGQANGGSSATGGIEAAFSGIFSKVSSVFSTVFSSITSVLSKIGGSIGGLFGGIGSFFGGFLANGGDVTPGKAYIVGEKHPEFFVPKQAGQVAPSLSMGGTTHHTSIVHMHLHGVNDADSFRRSGPQIMAQLHRVNAIAYARNS